MREEAAGKEEGLLGQEAAGKEERLLWTISPKWPEVSSVGFVLLCLVFSLHSYELVLITPLHQQKSFS